MTAIEMLNLLVVFLKEHRKDAAKSIVRNKHLTSFWKLLPQRVIDAVMIDFINSLAGERYGIDYALSILDLEDEEIKNDVHH